MVNGTRWQERYHIGLTVILLFLCYSDPSQVNIALQPRGIPDSETGCKGTFLHIGMGNVLHGHPVAKLSVSVDIFVRSHPDVV